MSRVGKVPINIPDGVKVNLKEDVLRVNGPKGSLELNIPLEVKVEINPTDIAVSRKGDNQRERSFHGLIRTLISNMITGVKDGFQKRLELSGVGYRAEVKGNTLQLALGYSNPVIYNLPEGISAEVEKQTSIILKGADKQVVGQIAAEIRALRKPEPYKGKGVRYANEHIRRKAGKAGVKGQ
ncbi:MAG: 50S ribosomal protein L6 [Thermodesulfobacteriota bacterium]